MHKSLLTYFLFLGFNAVFILGCVSAEDEEKGDVCIHLRQKVTYTDNTCTTEDTGNPPTPAYFCEEDVKEADCGQMPTPCPTSAPYVIYNDDAKFYKKKECKDDNYTLSCPGNSKYKVAGNTAFCP
ncbi:MAG: hypothetical protein LDLANPLL_02259 [Turneriella sp.]|nr:hypothetical protein [Turneriella sp.]